MVAEWSKAIDCKSIGNTIVGSNPTHLHTQHINFIHWLLHIIFLSVIYFYSWLYLNWLRNNFYTYFWFFLKICAIIALIMFTLFIIFLCILIEIFHNDYIFIVYIICSLYIFIIFYYFTFYFPNTRIFNLIKYYLSKLYNRIILVNFKRVFKIIANTIVVLLLICVLVFPQHVLIKHHIFMLFCLFIVFTIWIFFFTLYLRSNPSAMKMFFTVIIYFFWGLVLLVILYYLYILFLMIYTKVGYLIYFYFFL